MIWFVLPPADDRGHFPKVSLTADRGHFLKVSPTNYWGHFLFLFYLTIKKSHQTVRNNLEHSTFTPNSTYQRELLLLFSPPHRRGKNKMF
jgi:hypothetical protein